MLGQDCLLRPHRVLECDLFLAIQQAAKGVRVHSVGAGNAEEGLVPQLKNSCGVEQDVVATGGGLCCKACPCCHRDGRELTKWSAVEPWARPGITGLAFTSDGHLLILTAAATLYVVDPATRARLGTHQLQV